MVIKMHVSAACQLKLSRYPFGRYTCNVTVRCIPDKCFFGESLLTQLYYDRDRDLLDYHLDNETVQIENDQFTLTLYLTGQADYHLLGSFSPSALMFLICYSTLYYPITNFNERLMASITSLLVLVALFSQATATNVKTPYFKLLDVWYVVLIALCFLVVFANSLTHIIQERGGYMQTVAAEEEEDAANDDIIKYRVSKCAAWCNNIFRCSLLTIFILLAVTYGLVGSEYI